MSVPKLIHFSKGGVLTVVSVSVSSSVSASIFSISRGFANSLASSDNRVFSFDLVIIVSNSGYYYAKGANL